MRTPESRVGDRHARDVTVSYRAAECVPAVSPGRRQASTPALSASKGQGDWGVSPQSLELGGWAGGKDALPRSPRGTAGGDDGASIEHGAGRLPAATTAPTPVVNPDVGVITQQKLEPPYALILHNDPVNTMHHVVQSLLHCVPTLEEGEAFEIMMQAHDNGQARVVVASHEEASRYRNCLESRGLTSTIEPAYD